MYDDIKGNVSENIKIMGYPFYAENIDGDEPYNRREYIHKPLLNGTETVKPGKYIPREYSFQTTVYHATGKPDAYDKIIQEIMSKPVEVISPYMGKDAFKAIVVFTKRIEEASPNHMVYDVTVTEVPGKQSNIPGEAILIVPDIKKITIKKSGSNNKNTSKANKTLNKQLSKCNVPYRKSQKNKCVKLLQEKLINLGYLKKKYKTGVYDNNTVNAVKSFQRSTKGKLAVDGIVGKYTRSYLIKT